MSEVCNLISKCRYNKLCGVGLVVHEEEVDISDVVNKESLVSRGHHVSRLLVGSETNLSHLSAAFRMPRLWCFKSYRWHNHLSLEASSDSVVDTLWLPPARVDTHVGVALMSVKALGAYYTKSSVYRSNHRVT